MYITLLSHPAREDTMKNDRRNGSCWLKMKGLPFSFLHTLVFATTLIPLFALPAFAQQTWTRTYGGTDTDIANSVRQTSDGGYIVAGATNSFGAGSYDVYLIKMDANGNVGIEEQSEVRGKKLEGRITVRPNPFASFATIPGHEGKRFNLYDIAGRKVGTYKGDRIGENAPPGVYFLRLEGKNVKPIRIVKLR
jgi:hypothetical protein